MNGFEEGRADCPTCKTLDRSSLIPSLIRMAAHAFFAVFLLLSSTGQLIAQSYSFSSVTIEGNRRIAAETIVSYAGIGKGVAVSAGDLNEAFQRIQGSGLFEKVEIEPRGSVLVIRVVEYPTINKIAFEGNKKLKSEDLAGFIKSEVRRVYSPAQAERDAATLAEAYSQNGRVAARVTPKVIRRNDNRVDLVFEIFEGRKVEVERIGFVGNRAFSDRRLRKVIGSKQTGLLRAFIQSDTFVEDRLQFDRQVLTDFYNSRGFVDFRVTGTNAELARGRDGYFVTFNIQEGQQFRFGQISTESEINGVDAEEYQNILKIRPGVIYSPTLVENSVSRMEQLSLKNGVDFMQVEPRITRNDRDLTLDVEFVLKRGPRVFVERIDVEGNTTTLDRVVRRQFDIVEGDPFNPRAIREAANRIRALRYFKNVDVNAQEGSSPDQVVVKTEVEETTTGSASIGVSFSSNNGVGLQFGLSERNFIGRGQELTAQLLATSDTLNFNLKFVEPAFLGRNVALGLDFSFLETQSDFSDFDTQIGAFRPSLTFPTSENGRLSVFYNGRYEDMFDYTGTSGILQAETNEGGLFSSGVGYQFTYDTRKGGLDPTSGVYLSFGNEFGGLGGDTDFIRTTARIIGEKAVLNEEVTLRASLEAGAIEFTSGESRFVNRYSDQIIRGFKPNGIGPTESGEQLGGDYFAALKFEAEFPLGLPDEYGITGGAFYDIGSIWGIDTSNATGPVDSTGFKARHVIGLSVFWNSPFGPLRMNFSNALKKESGDEEQQFNLTVKTDF